MGVVLAAGAAAGAVAGGLWFYLWPRTITLWVMTDLAFHERPHWQAVLDSRFRALNELYAGTGVRWRVLAADRPDPVAGAGQLDLRRAELERQVDAPADVVVSVTVQPEGDRLGSVNPFSHAALVEDFPGRSEEQNTLILAHELARLFGAPAEPPGSGTLMALPPERPGFAPRTAALIHRLRRYDFARGVDALEGSWSGTVLDALSQAYTRPSPRPLAHAQLTVALALENEGRPAAAAAHAREAVRLDPQSIDARQALAQVLVADMQVDAALRELREAVRLFPNNAGLHGTLGAALGKQAQTEDALRELRRAEELDPRNANYPVSLGTLLVQQAGQMEEGVAEFQKAAQLDPASTTAQVWLSRMADMRAQATSDLDADRRRTREAPQDADAFYRLGVDEERLGDHVNARAALQKAVELNPRHGRALSDLAAMDYYCNDPQAAMRHLRAAIAAGFDPPTALASAIERRLQGQAGKAPGSR